MRHARHELSLHPPDPIVRSVGGEHQIAETALWIEEKYLDVLPILLVRRSVELDAVVEPLGLPADFVVCQRIGSKLERCRKGSVQMQSELRLNPPGRKP